MNAAGIKKIAFGIFADKGYDATTMMDISEACGLHKASVYFQFESKSSLFLEIFNEQANDFIKSISTFFNELNSNEIETILKNFFLKTVQYFLSRQKLIFWSRIILLKNTYVDQEIEEHLNQKIIEIDDLIKDKLSSVLPETDQKLFYNYHIFVLSFVIFMLLVDGNPDEKAQDSWDIFWNGVTIK